MNVQSVYQNGAVQNAAGPPPVGRFSGGVSRTAAVEGGSGSHPEGQIDLVGLESVGEAFRTLSRGEPLAIPEPVGKAIRQMVKEVLEGLPGG